MKNINLKVSRLWMILLSTAVLCFYSCASRFEEEIGKEAQLMNDVTLNVSSSSLSMFPSMKFQVTYTAVPENVTFPGVSWVSSKSDIADVSQDGLITAKTLGKAFINISQKTTGFNVLKSLEVNVLPPATSITAKNFQLIEGSTANLADTKYVTLSPVNGYNSYDVVSSNTSVIIFENGLVKAVAPGTATITVKTKDGSNLQSTATVTVIPSIPPTNLTIVANQEFGNNEFGAKLDFTVTPTNATLELIKWSSSDPTIATIDEKGTINTLSFGSVIITATLPSGTQIKQSISVEKGKINDYNLGLNIYTLTLNATSNLSNGIETVTYASGQKRSDFVRPITAAVPLFLNADKYPIIAIRSNASTVSKLWHAFDSKVSGNTSGGSATLGAINFLDSKSSAATSLLSAKNGTRVFYVDIRNIKWGTYSLVGQGAQQMQLFQFKTGTDSAPQDLSYNVYWIKTFKSVTEMNAFIANE
jgi:uncharacterized protein YjdB